MSESQSSAQRASRMVAWTFFQAVLLHFWKIAIPFFLAGLTVVLGYVSATPMPLMWILFATAGVFAFSTIAVLGISVYWHLKTDVHKLRVNGARATRCIVNDRDSLMFEVELQNLATFPLQHQLELKTLSAQNRRFIYLLLMLIHRRLPRFGPRALR